LIKGEEVIKINIPAGVQEGMQLSMSGKGNAARRGGMNGDLIILVEEAEHPDLVRDGNDLVYNLFVSISDAALGSAVEIPTVDGKVKVKIEPGTQPGKILRLRGKGIPELNGYGKGDLLVRISVWIPKSLSKEERRLVEELGKSSNFAPNPTAAEKGVFRKMKEMFD
jgi:molecular chaperone DnaJ